MKPKDFMIGDIVMAHLEDGGKAIDFPVVIDGIDKNGTLVEGDSYFSWVHLYKEHNYLEYADDLEPIPLTKEIVFANGFQGNGCKGELVHKTDKQLKLYYDIDHFNGTDWIVKEWSVCGVAGIEYVHEYQHYLRLVGKEEFADNFKI